MTGRFTAGRRARRRSASGLAHTPGEVAHWPDRGCAGSRRDTWLMEGACAVFDQCQALHIPTSASRRDGSHYASVH